MNVRSVLGTGRLRWYLLPPGAVGGLYGSGCFHLSSNSSVSWMIACDQVRNSSRPRSTHGGMERTLCCRGCMTCLFASNSDRM